MNVDCICVDKHDVEAMTEECLDPVLKSWRRGEEREEKLVRPGAVYIKIVYHNT